MSRKEKSLGLLCQRYINYLSVQLKSFRKLLLIKVLEHLSNGTTSKSTDNYMFGRNGKSFK